MARSNISFLDFLNFPYAVVIKTTNKPFGKYLIPEYCFGSGVRAVELTHRRRAG